MSNQTFYDYFNPCAPMGLLEDNQSVRKGIFAEVFLLYLSYLAITILSYQKNPSQDSSKSSNNQDGQNPQPNHSGQQFITVENLNKFFSTFLGYHIFPIGIALLWSPNNFGIAVAFLHFLGYLAVLGGYKFEKEMIMKAGYAFSQFCNLLLILGGLVQLGMVDNQCYYKIYV
ncbi:hypothetical protein pb186bvf_009721 [Paramecium bursaria]